MFSDPRTGAPLILAHLAVLGASLLLGLVWVGIGARVRAAIAPPADGGLPLDWQVRWPLDAGLGAGTLATALLLAGAAGFLRPWGVLVVTAVVAAPAFREVITAARELAGGLREALTDGRVMLPATGGVVLSALLLAGALGPPTDWDALMYHLRIPLWFLEVGRIALPPDSLHVGLVGASHFSTLPLLAAGFLAGPAVMQVFTLGLILAATWAMARAVGSATGGRWLSLAAVLGCPAIVLVAITARVDVAVVLPLVAAHALLLDFRGRDDRSAVFIASVLVGIAIAMKPLAAVYALALAPLAWRAAGGRRRALLAAGIALAVLAPWLVKSHLLTGTPFYPRGAPGWFEPWLAEIFGTHVRPAWLDTSIRLALRESRDPVSLIDLFLSPARMTIEAEGRFYALSPLFILVPLVLVQWRTRRGALGVAFVGMAYVLIVGAFGQINLRYLIPAFPALAVAGAAAADGLLARRSLQVRRLMLGVIAVLALLPLVPAARARFGGQAVLLRHAVGALPASAVWRMHPDLPVRLYAPVVRNVHQLVPADARILLFWEARGLPLERDVLVDVRLSNWSFLAQSPAAANCLAGTGITHVLANSGGTQYYIGRGADRASFRLDEYEAFRDRCAEVTRVGPGFELLELRPIASPPESELR